jgi:hypothetical protein
VKPPLVVFVNDFGGTNPPFRIIKCGLEAIEVAGAPTEFAFDVRTSRRSDAKPNRFVVFGE